MPTNPKLLISAETLRELRAMKALSQEALAQQANISVQRIKQIEKGGATVFPKTALKLADFFGVDIPDLLTRR